MRLANHANLPPDALEVLEHQVLSHTSLVDAIVFVGPHHEGPVLPRVVVQDEYSHDVVFPWRDGLYLAYSTT
jgi:hypothetical protein